MGECTLKTALFMLLTFIAALIAYTSGTGLIVFEGIVIILLFITALSVLYALHVKAKSASLLLILFYLAMVVNFLILGMNTTRPVWAVVGAVFSLLGILLSMSGIDCLNSQAGQNGKMIHKEKRTNVPLPKRELSLPKVTKAKPKTTKKKVTKPATKKVTKAKPKAKPKPKKKVAKKPTTKKTKKAKKPIKKTKSTKKKAKSKRK